MAEKIAPDAPTALEGLLFDGMTIMAGGLAFAASPRS
jgi:3-oxoacid CoA-transferase subunit A